MGKIRVKTIGDEQTEKKQKEEAKKRKEVKRLEEIEAQKRLAKTPAEREDKTEKPAVDYTIVSESPLEEAKQEAAENNEEQTEEKKETKTSPAPKKEVVNNRVQKHSTKYNTVSSLVDKRKTYKVSEALEILPKVHLATFDETVELHINTSETGVSGNVVLPHGTGKTSRVAIADDAILADVEKGNINFDVLVAHPSMMPKLAKVARILGPRGLMPNPKNGTISPNPEEAAKKFEGGQINFKTEPKNPIIHLSIGKLSFDAKQLVENFETAIRAVGKNKIKSVTLKSTMSPGIKVAA